MVLFTWSNKYSVKVRKFDEQHQELIAIINKLHDAMLKKDSKTVMAGIVESLLRYVNIHFGNEEELMQQFDYPGFHDHKRAHDEMREYVLALSEAYENNKIIISVKVMEFLKKWLAQHILGVDQLYQEFFNREGIY
jgi:hemerythrin